MEHLIFEWDEAKAAVNLQKHGIDFQMAGEVFLDPNHILRQDRFENNEYRWQAIGLTTDRLLLLLVAHTYREQNGQEHIRIISARRATKAERKNYEQQNRHLYT